MSRLRIDLCGRWLGGGGTREKASGGRSHVSRPARAWVKKRAGWHRQRGQILGQHTACTSRSAPTATTTAALAGAPDSTTRPPIPFGTPHCGQNRDRRDLSRVIRFPFPFSSQALSVDASPRLCYKVSPSPPHPPDHSLIAQSSSPHLSLPAHTPPTSPHRECSSHRARLPPTPLPRIARRA